MKIVALPVLVAALLLGILGWAVVFVLRPLADLLGSIPLIGGAVRAGYQALEDAIAGLIEAGYRGVEGALDELLDGLRSVVRDAQQVIGAVVDRLSTALEWLWATGIPAAINAGEHAILGAISAIVQAAKTAADYALDLVHKLESRLEALAGFLEREILAPFKALEGFVTDDVWPGLQGVEHDLAHFFAHDIPQLLTRLGDLERQMFGDVLYRIGETEQALYDLVRKSEFGRVFEDVLGALLGGGVVGFLRLQWQMLRDLWQLAQGNPRPLLKDLLHDTEAVALGVVDLAHEFVSLIVEEL